MAREIQTVALEALFREERWLYQLARRLVRDDATARDLVQDTWTAALENPPPDTSRPRSWLSAVAHRIALKQRARQGPTYLDDLEGRFPVEGEVPEQATHRWEASQTLRELVGSLAEPRRAALLLTHQEGLGQQEVARHLGISTRAVRKRLAAAYEEIRHGLGSERALRDGSWVVVILPLIDPRDFRRTAATAVGLPALVLGLLALLAVAVGTAIARFPWAVGDGPSLAAAAPVEPSGPAPPTRTEATSPPAPVGQAGNRSEEGLPAAREAPADPLPPAAGSPAEDGQESQSAALYWIRGRVLFDGAPPDDWEAWISPSTYIENHIDEQGARLAEDGTFEVGAREPGMWKLTIWPYVPIGTSRLEGQPVYRFRMQLSEGSEEHEVKVTVPRTTRVIVKTDDYPMVRLWWPAEAGGWEYLSGSPVEGGQAVFHHVPVGQVQVRHRQGDKLVNWNDFLLLGSFWLEDQEENVIDLDP